jgi:uncharacterized protein DUF6502
LTTDHLYRALRHLLRPIFRLLLRNGVTWREFAEVGKEVFVEVAREDYGIQRRPTNTARVALMTGLNRQEVTRIKNVLIGARDRGEAPVNRISQILTAWHTDSEFLAADGSPLVLPAEGDGASVATLLKHYAGNVPHGAVLKELQQLELVERTDAGFRIKARHYIRSAADPDLVRQAGISLHDHGTTIAHNLDDKRTEPPRFERSATQLALPQRHVRAFRELLEIEGNAFLEKIDTWLAARAAREKTRGRVVRTGVGVYLIHDEKRGHRA